MWISLNVNIIFAKWEGNCRLKKAQKTAITLL